MQYAANDYFKNPIFLFFIIYSKVFQWEINNRSWYSSEKSIHQMTTIINYNIIIKINVEF